MAQRGSAKKQQRQQRQQRQQARASRREADNDALFNWDMPETRRFVRDNMPIRAKNGAQERYIQAIKHYTLTIATGPAGTGKTWLAAALAAEALEAKQVEKIIITRPAIEAGENLGFLPGELEEKFDPYLQPFRDVLIQRLRKGAFEYHQRVGNIEAVPLAYMRGRTFKSAWVILDEAQNTTPTQMKMFLTRIGEDCKVIVNGDVRQQDIRGESGLLDAVKRVSFIPAVKVVTFSRADVVRSGLTQEIVEAYEREAA